jgi:hypothetical protein
MLEGGWRLSRRISHTPNVDQSPYEDTTLAEPSFRSPPLDRGNIFNQARASFQNGILLKFLTTLREGESLKIDLGEHYEPEDVDAPIRVAVTTVDDVFAYEHTWPKIRKLALRHFDTSTKALIPLLKRHQPSLRDLRLHDMSLELEQLEEDSSQKVHWCLELLQEMSAASSLERATLNGHFFTIDSSGSLDFNKDCGWDSANYNLADAAARYLIQGALARWPSEQSSSYT